MTEQTKKPAAAHPHGAGLTGQKPEQADKTTESETGTDSGSTDGGSGTVSTNGAGLT
jgi:hypothetical protein